MVDTTSSSYRSFQFVNLCPVRDYNMPAGVFDTASTRAAAILADIVEVQERYEMLSRKMLGLFEARQRADEPAEVRQDTKH